MFESRILPFSLIFSEEAYKLVLTWVVNMLTQLINRSSILIKNIIIIFFLLIYYSIDLLLMLWFSLYLLE